MVKLPYKISPIFIYTSPIVIRNTSMGCLLEAMSSLLCLTFTLRAMPTPSNGASGGENRTRTQWFLHGFGQLESFQNPGRNLRKFVTFTGATASRSATFWPLPVFRFPSCHSLRAYWMSLSQVDQSSSPSPHSFCPVLFFALGVSYTHGTSPMYTRSAWYSFSCFSTSEWL